MGLFSKKGRAEPAAEKSSKEHMMELFETIDGATARLELIKKEYEEVNRYLQDAQIIGELPEEMKEELCEQATRLIQLKEDMADSDKKRNDMTEFQYGILERYEENLPTEIKRLKKEEDYKKEIESDLRTLAGEKGVLLHEAEEEIGKKKFLNRMGFISGFLLSFLLLMYPIFFLIFETFLAVPFLLTVAGGILLILYLFIETERNKKAIKLNRAKMGRLTEVTNKIKIKYVNQTSSLDFSHDKFAVNSARELEERFRNYLEYKEEEKKRKKANAHYERAKDRFKAFLERFQVHDTEVWVFQPYAVIDKKEMVEIRHHLNERRGKLRESLRFQTALLEESIEKLKEIAEKNPEERRALYEMAEIYKVQL